MTLPSLNLLRFPKRQRLPYGVGLRQIVPGLCLGLLCGMCWGWWCQWRLPALLTSRQALQARLQLQAREQAQAVTKARQAREQQQVGSRHKDWQARRAQLRRLHGVLEQAAVDQGLRVQQWQGDERRIQLHAWLPHAQGWPQLQQQLSAVGPQVWILQSLASDPQAGVRLVLEAPWATATQAQEGRAP